MDPELKKNAENWLKRGRKFHDKEHDPHSAYFAYLLALLVIARDHANHHGYSGRSHDEAEIRKALTDHADHVVEALLHASDYARWLGDREATIIFVDPSRYRNRDDQYTKDQDSLRSLARWFRGEDDVGRPVERAKQFTTLVWLVRNNLFHGDKAYSTGGQWSKDTNLLDRMCRLLDAVLDGLLKRR